MPLSVRRLSTEPGGNNELLDIHTISKVLHACLDSLSPYVSALSALKARYGQPRQLVQSEIASILHSPPVRLDDNSAFQDFALSVHSLFGIEAVACRGCGRKRVIMWFSCR